MDYKKQLNEFISQDKILGIDVSRCQGVIDFPFVLDKYDWIKFVILKCTESTWTDDRFVANLTSFRQSTKNVGIGIYAVIHPDEDPVKQAQATIDACKNQEFVPMFSMVDFETPYKKSKQEIAKNVVTMYNMFSEAFGKPIAIYSYFGYIQPFLQYFPKDTKYAIANYSFVNYSHPGIEDNQLILKQVMGWIPYGLCQKCPCYDATHQHGILLQLRKDDKGTPVDINVDCGFIEPLLY